MGDRKRRLGRIIRRSMLRTNRNGPMFCPRSALGSIHLGGPRLGLFHARILGELSWTGIAPGQARARWGSFGARPKE